MILAKLLSEYDFLLLLLVLALMVAPGLVLLLALTALTIASMLGSPVATAILAVTFVTVIIGGILKWLGVAFLEMVDETSPKPPKKQETRDRRTKSQKLRDEGYTVRDIVKVRRSHNPVTLFLVQQHAMWKAWMGNWR